MHTVKNIHYFGKLRRRREYLSSSGLEREEYLNWEKWFAKCSNSNLLVPFLESRNKVENTWLFAVVREKSIRIGLTALSKDMSGRKYPFLMYTNLNNNTNLTDDVILESLLYMAYRYQNFIKILSDGNFREYDCKYFISIKDTPIFSDVNYEMIESMVKSIIIFKGNNIYPSSCWLNLQSFKFIEHDNAFTCSLYNKIYG